MPTRIFIGAAVGLLLLLCGAWLLRWAEARTETFYRSLNDAVERAHAENDWSL